MTQQAKHSPRGVPWPRFVGFLVVFFLLQIGWQAFSGSSVEQAVVHAWTVRPAAAFINLLTPAAHAEAIDSTLRAARGGLNVLNGCEGSEVLFLLLAAFAVAPLSWRARTYGLLLGTLVVFAVDQARILVLFYAFQADPGLFEWLHTVVTPIVVVLLVLGYFYGWLLHASEPVAPAR